MSMSTPKGTKYAAESSKVTHAFPITLIGVQYSDGRGQIRRDIWYKMGAKYYAHKSGEKFTQEMSPVYNTLVTSLEALMSSNTEEDKVDVIAADIAESVGLEERQPPKDTTNES